MIELTKQNEIDLYAYEVTEQLKQMYYETAVEGKVIIDYPIYFLNGIIMQRHNLTTPTAKADGVLFRKHPTYHLSKEEAEARLGRTTLERKTVFQEGKVCANYAIRLAILFSFFG